jgi:hypothetical protein
VLLTYFSTWASITSLFTLQCCWLIPRPDLPSPPNLPYSTADSFLDLSFHHLLIYLPVLLTHFSAWASITSLFTFQCCDSFLELSFHYHLIYLPVLLTPSSTWASITSLFTFQCCWLIPRPELPSPPYLPSSAVTHSSNWASITSLFTFQCCWLIPRPELPSPPYLPSSAADSFLDLSFHHLLIYLPVLLTHFSTWASITSLFTFQCCWLIPRPDLPSPPYLPSSAADLLPKFHKTVLDTYCDEVPIRWMLLSSSVWNIICPNVSVMWRVSLAE